MLFNLLAAVSLGLCLGIATLGLLSRRWGGERSFTRLSQPDASHLIGDRFVIAWYGRTIDLHASRSTATTPQQEANLPGMLGTSLSWSPTGDDFDIDPPLLVEDSKFGRLGEHLRCYLWTWTTSYGDSALHCSTQTGIDLTFPAWLGAAVFALLPAFWLLRRLIRRKRPCPGFCQKCGYDLRATPERCPECGTAVPAPAPPVAQEVSAALLNCSPQDTETGDARRSLHGIAMRFLGHDPPLNPRVRPREFHPFPIAGGIDAMGAKELKQNGLEIGS